MATQHAQIHGHSHSCYSAGMRAPAHKGTCAEDRDPGAPGTTSQIRFTLHSSKQPLCCCARLSSNRVDTWRGAVHWCGRACMAHGR
eukprot:741439-Lingulodinium_polyedra.AAC.1